MFLNDLTNYVTPGPVLSDSDSLSLSQQASSATDKSSYGKWKRKKGPAPSRPVPQRRQIRPLPLAELRRELDIIEVQQQGLEKQGVKLEQLIREKCETPGALEGKLLIILNEMDSNIFFQTHPYPRTWKNWCWNYLN